MRTTVDIDAPLLLDVKRLQKQEGKTQGQVINELLSAGLRGRSAKPLKRRRLNWPAKAMGQRIEIDDREALWALLSEEEAQK